MTTTPGTTTGTQQFDSTTGSTASTATDEGRRVAGVAVEEVRDVASEAKTQIRQVVDETRSQANDQAKAQRDRLVDTLRTLATTSSRWRRSPARRDWPPSSRVRRRTEPAP